MKQATAKTLGVVALGAALATTSVGSAHAFGGGEVPGQALDPGAAVETAETLPAEAVDPLDAVTQALGLDQLLEIVTSGSGDLGAVATPLLGGVAPGSLA